MSTIRESHIALMQKELLHLFKIEAESNQSAVIKTSTPFALGLVVGFVMSRWTRDGISFNRMQIDTHRLTVKLQVLRNQALNNLQVEWV